MTVLAAIAGAVVFAIWAATDQSDDGVDVDPYPRLAYRRGTAARIDPGVALTAQTAKDPPDAVTVWTRSAGGPWIRKAST